MEYSEILQGVPIHDVTASQLSIGLVEAFLHELGSLGQFSRSTLRRSSGEEWRSSQKDLLPLPLPNDVRNVLLDRGRLIEVATEKPNARSKRTCRTLGIALWSFLVICSLNFNWYGQSYQERGDFYDFMPSPGQEVALKHIADSVVYFVDWCPDDGEEYRESPPNLGMIIYDRRRYHIRVKPWRWLSRRLLWRWPLAYNRTALVV